MGEQIFVAGQLALQMHYSSGKENEYAGSRGLTIRQIRSVNSRKERQVP